MNDATSVQPVSAEAPADGLDSLFGDPAPATDAAPAADAAPTDAAPAADALDDLFGASPDEPAAEVSVDDLFGSTVTETETESVEELPAPIRSDDFVTTEAKNFDVQIVSKAITTSIDPLADTIVRTWVDNTGDFSTEGRLFQINADNIRLIKSNGRTCTVPTSRMSPADAAYVDSIREQIKLSQLALLSSK